MQEVRRGVYGSLAGPRCPPAMQEITLIVHDFICRGLGMRMDVVPDEIFHYNGLINMGVQVDEETTCADPSLPWQSPPAPWEGQDGTQEPSLDASA